VGSRGLPQPIEGQERVSKERTEQRMIARKLPRSGLVQRIVSKLLCYVWVTHWEIIGKAKPWMVRS